MTAEATNASLPIEREPPTSRRRWWFRPAAVLLGLSTFVIAEGAFVLFDVGRPAPYEDPFVGFSEIRPLFALDAGDRQYHIPEPKLLHFAPESFSAEKGANEFRVFCLGGSTVKGRPYSKQTSFTTWLELSLQTAQGDRHFDIVNCGGVSYASYRLLPILKECLSYKPDLFVICTGHNEFLEDRTYPRIKHTARWSAHAHELAERLRTYNLLRAVANQFANVSSRPEQGERSKLSGEVDAFLDYKEGLKAYERDDEWRAGVVAHFEENLKGMISTAQSAGVPVIVVLPPSNLAASSPFKSQHRAGMTAAETEQWQSLVAESAQYVRTDLNRAIDVMSAALELDDQYALLHFQLGTCYEAQGKLASARRHYELAREHDICPLRAVASIENAIRETAAATGVPLVDAHQLLESRCPSGILGEQFLVDHVHPSIEGHELIAEALFNQMVRMGWLNPAAGWEAQRSRVYKDHMQTLDDIYFARGQQRLDNLRAWVKGRADGPPLSEHPKLKKPGDRQ